MSWIPRISGKDITISSIFFTVSGSGFFPSSWDKVSFPPWNPVRRMRNATTKPA